MSNCDSLRCRARCLQENVPSCEWTHRVSVLEDANSFFSLQLFTQIWSHRLYPRLFGDPFFFPFFSAFESHSTNCFGVWIVSPKDDLIPTLNLSTAGETSKPLAVFFLRCSAPKFDWRRQPSSLWAAAAPPLRRFVASRRQRQHVFFFFRQLHRFTQCSVEGFNRGSPTFSLVSKSGEDCLVIQSQNDLNFSSPWF